MNISEITENYKFTVCESPINEIKVKIKDLQVKELSETEKTRRLAQFCTDGESPVRLFMSKFNSSRFTNRPACSDKVPFRKFSDKLSFVKLTKLPSAFYEKK